MDISYQINGHVIGVSKTKQIYINETTCEKSHSVSIGIMDIDPKKKQVSGHGYGIGFSKDGTKTLRTWKGQAVGKGHWKGTWTLVEGGTGGGTWGSWSIAPQHSYYEVEGDWNPEQ